MSGLNLGLGGGINLGGSQGRAPASTATISQTAYGAGSSPSSGGGGFSLAHVGAIGVPLVCLVGLVFLRWSLPK